MRTNLKFATVGEAPPRSPARTALAAAIERLDAAQRTLAANEVAQETTTQTRRQAQAAVERLVAMIEEAKANAATYLTAQAMGTAGEAPLPVKAARDNAVAAQDALDAAFSAGAALVEQQKSAEKELHYAESGVDRAILEVAKAETAAAVSELLTQAEAAQAEVVNKRAVLRYLLHNGFVEEQAAPAVKGFLRNKDLPGTYGDIEMQDWNRHPACAPFHQARAALRENPDAELPV